MRTTKLSDAQRRTLENLRDGREAHAGIHGNSAHGAFGAVLVSCRTHGLIASVRDVDKTLWHVTEKGYAALSSGRFVKGRGQ